MRLLIIIALDLDAVGHDDRTRAHAIDGHAVAVAQVVASSLLVEVRGRIRDDWRSRDEELQVRTPTNQERDRALEMHLDWRRR